MTKNPNWTRDELILALDLYFREGRKWLSPTHPSVIKLSQTLNTLPIHNPEIRNSDFRNPDGVSMKLGNFLNIDPEYKGSGLHRGAKLDKDVWDEFSNDIYRLTEIARAIIDKTNHITKSNNTNELDEINEEFPEGQILTRLHKHKERNRKAVEQKKQKILKTTGKLMCEVCNFDFAHTYGKLGYGFAECHHIIPISQLSEHHRTKLEDLSIVCANCHRMLHRSRPMLTIQELRTLVQQNATL